MQGGGRLNKQRAAKKEWDEWKEEEDRRLSSVFVGRLEVKMGKDTINKYKVAGTSVIQLHEELHSINSVRNLCL